MEKLEDIDPVYKRMHQAGLVIADTDDKKRQEANLDRGTVIEVGPDAFKAYFQHANPEKNMSEFVPWCKVGDTIAFAKYSGKTVEDLDTHVMYTVINDEDVVAVLGETHG
jgi:co-chaperonin GroES (HSP10)